MPGIATMKLICLLSSSILLLIYPSFPCSSFLLTSSNSVFVGKNYDWDVESGSIIINKRNVRKTAFQVVNPVSWTSRYGSITFNQYGQDFPNGGMNEKGLVIEALWLDATRYSDASDTIPNIDNMQWIQYHLDISATVDDVVRNDSAICITPISAAAVHCLVTDKSGKGLIVEVIDGTLRHHPAASDSPPAITNDTYLKSVRMLNKCRLFGGNLDVPRGKGSITRFIKLAIALKEFKRSKSTPISYAFKTLRSVSLGGYTKWSIVYDVNNYTVYYTTRSNSKMRSTSLKRFNLSCSDSTKSISLVNKHSEDITSLFVNHSIESNRVVVTSAFKTTSFLKHKKPDVIREFFTYPMLHNCLEKHTE